LGSAASVISDISGDPVITGNRVYIGNFGGRTAAFDLQDGTRLWTATDGSVSPVWAVGNAVFLINDINELVRLDASFGAPVWRTALPVLEEGANPRRERRIFAHYGPVLAGGRLIVTSSDGLIRQFDPASGALVGQLALPGGAASGPVVAGQTLYVLSKDGQLHAFR
jgi:outer membrane protein assembly factor BamB